MSEKMPVFKIMFQGRPYHKQQFAIEMGDRRIIFRAATGEQSSDGPFPYVDLMTKEGEGSWKGEGYPIHMAPMFEALWDLLKDPEQLWNYSSEGME